MQSFLSLEEESLVCHFCCCCEQLCCDVFPQNEKICLSEHLTAALLCVDQHGGVVAGVSTGGAPGRVGDSPLPGYADDKVSRIY